VLEEDSLEDFDEDVGEEEEEEGRWKQSQKK
jgi:hypothetical protein